MEIPLAQMQAVSELAKHLYDYLPGSTAWKGTYTFADAARDAGLAKYWIGGSKLPALTRLLEAALQNPGSFSRLVEQIVRTGIPYRIKKGAPLTDADVGRLNELVRRVGYKIPSLIDPSFLASLPQQRSAPVPSSQAESNAPSEATTRFDARLKALQNEFLALLAQQDRSGAGLSLERVLNGLFQLHDLEPNGAFRVVGEQIDGSFLLDREVYLLEAKWTAPGIPESDLLVFRGKIEGKSSFTRGLFISINGFTGLAPQALTTGKQPTFVMMDGADLYRVLEGGVRLDDLLRRKVRWLAERGQPFVSASELFG